MSGVQPFYKTLTPVTHKCPIQLNVNMHHNEMSMYHYTQPITYRKINSELHLWGPIFKKS